MIVHAGLVAKKFSGQWRGVLIEGPSESGKSDLALRVLNLGFRIVADDRVALFVAKGRLFGRAPAPLTGLLEVRGLGITWFDPVPFADVSLVVSCIKSGDAERLPRKKRSILIAGVRIPLAEIPALEASAPAKLCRAFEVLGSAAQQDYDAAFA